MKRKNLLLATIVALSMSATSVAAPLSALNLGAQTAYAGVIKRNVTNKSSQTTSAATTDASSDANTNQQETSINTAASSDGKTHTEVDSNGQTVKQQDLQDGASKYAISTYHGKTYSSDFHLDSNGYIVDEQNFQPLINPDGSPHGLKAPIIYPVEVYKSSDWLFPNGVAKTPGYLSAELEIETASFDDRISDNLDPLPEGYSHHQPDILYRTKFTTEDRLWPEVNPITGRPLWDTQPFWRSDNSFDLYGYLKQFTPEYKNRSMCIRADGPANWAKFGNKTMHSADITLIHDFDLANSNEIDSGGTMWLHITLANNAAFEAGYTGLPGGVYYTYIFRMPDGTWRSSKAHAHIKYGYEGQKIRITGTKDAYINETVLKSLEMIMHYYIDDHTFSNVVKHGESYAEIPIPGFDVNNAEIMFEADE